MAGDHVLMVSGSDMHGTPITVAADKLGMSARELAEANHLGIAESFERGSIRSVGSSVRPQLSH
jgi:methionyl-tRNA synthetase